MLEVKFTPFPEINTERLLLRKLADPDADILFSMRSSETVMKYIDKERTKDIDETLLLIRKINDAAEAGEGITWAMAFPEKPEELIGTIGFWRIMHQHYRAEIGYMLHPDHWSKGLMKEAVNALIRYGFDSMKLHSIEAHINPGNEASAGLLEKTGFVREAYFKEDFYFRGRFLDTAIYSLLEK